MNPSIGRIIHVNGYHGAAAALIVGVVNDQVVNVQVFQPDGNIVFLQNVEQGDNAGQWGWPPRA